MGFVVCSNASPNRKVELFFLFIYCWFCSRRYSTPTIDKMKISRKPLFHHGFLSLLTRIDRSLIFSIILLHSPHRSGSNRKKKKICADWRRADSLRKKGPRKFYHSFIRLFFCSWIIRVKFFLLLFFPLTFFRCFIFCSWLCSSDGKFEIRCCADRQSYYYTKLLHMNRIYHSMVIFGLQGEVIKHAVLLFGRSY